MKDTLLFITGVALFLFGMLKLSSSMQAAFSSRIREYIRFAVRKRLYGLVTGLFTTVLFQSSSATTLVTIGLVGAGLVSFYHSLAIILGADIGTTLTIQLIVWKITYISPVFLFAGIMIYFFGKERLRVVGEAILYFGIIFYGLSLIGDATAPLKDNAYFLHFFRDTQNPLFGFALGLVFAALVHASAIPIGVLVVLGQQGVITIDNAFPIVLGANVGTTVTALLGGMVSNADGRRSALAHLVFKCVGALLCLIIMPFFIVFLKGLSSHIAQQVAFGHFFSNLLIVFLFVGFLKPFSKFLKKIIPGEEETLTLWPEYLETKCLVSPDAAMDCIRKELAREMAIAKKMFRESMELLGDYREQISSGIAYMELVVDNLQNEITNYLWNISSSDLTPGLTKKLFAFSSFTNDIERVGDHATNIVELARSIHEKKVLLSKEAEEELRQINGLVMENLTDAESLIKGRNVEIIRAIFERERRVNVKIKNAVDNHLERFYRKECRAEAGPIYLDILINLERISDHCRLMAQLADGLDGEGARG